jgi:hypothetical protein
VVVRGDAVGDVVGTDLDLGAAVGLAQRPGHRHGPGEGGVVGLEVDRLDHPFTGHHVEEAGVHHVRARGGLPCRHRRIVVGEHQPVGATGSKVEVLEPTAHAGRRQPRKELVFVGQRPEHAVGRGSDDPRGDVGARHGGIIAQHDR